MGPDERPGPPGIIPRVNGIHDLGGRDGFGRVEIEVDEPVFHERWEARVFGLNLGAALGAGLENIDAMRHRIERIPPVAYLTLGYYERWLRSLESLLRDRGILREGELEAAMAGRPFAPEPLPPLPGPPANPGARRDTRARPLFAVGDRVVTRNHQPHGHTRLPGYARGRRGVVERLYGTWVFPDSNAAGEGECPQHLYCVAFEARELWGDAAEPRSRVQVDLFESYLTRCEEP